MSWRDRISIDLGHTRGLTEILEASPGAILALNCNWTVAYANKQAATLFGCDQGQLNGSAALIGDSCRLSEFSAALGEAQLNHRGEWLQGQAAVFGRYRAALDGAPFAAVLEAPDGGEASGYKFIALAATPQTREELRAHLARHGISLAGGVYETLLPDDPRFRPHAAPGTGPFRAARDFAARHFCLPAWPGLTRQEQDRVTAALDSFRPSP